MLILLSAQNDYDKEQTMSPFHQMSVADNMVWVVAVTLKISPRHSRCGCDDPLSCGRAESWTHSKLSASLLLCPPQNVSTVLHYLHVKCSLFVAHRKIQQLFEGVIEHNQLFMASEPSQNILLLNLIISWLWSKLSFLFHMNVVFCWTGGPFLHILFLYVWVFSWGPSFFS